MPGNPQDHRAWQGISAHETVHFLGTEPFWGGRVAKGRMTYTTPRNPSGDTVPVSRFAGRGGVSFAGMIDGQGAMLAVTAAACQDGMSNTRYPFLVTLKLGDDIRQGCGWTERQPRTIG